jgi:multiple sugar transport system ATP-binding protein
MIAGLESISGGELSIGDRVVNNLPAKQRDIAMVFQNYALYPHMTAYQNMAFALTLRKLPRSEVDRRVREAADVLGIQPLLLKRPRQMSGGERQRVALGRALVRKPEVFLFDEPLSNLDAKLRVHMRREIARLHKQLGTTMIYVTHDQVEAMTLGDRIVVLHLGEMQQADTPTALYQRPRNTFVAGFIGAPPMNLIEGELMEEGSRFRSKTGGFELQLSSWSGARPRTGCSVILGVRPEDLQLVLPKGSNVDPRSVISARVEMVELLGGEALVHLSSGGVDLTARLPVPLPATDGELRLTPTTVHFFDGETGDRLDA